MAISRTQYVTVAELNEVLGTAYDECDTILDKIYQASELLEYHMRDSLNTYTVLTAPNKLKLATAYQFDYNENVDTNDYTGNSKSVSIGRTSETTNFGTSDFQEYRKISPKALRYLIDGGLTRRLV